MRPRIAVAAASALVAGALAPAVAQATTGPAASGIAAAAQYQPETTGTVPVEPTLTTTPSESPPVVVPPVETAPSTNPPVQEQPVQEQPVQEPTVQDSDQPTTRPVANPEPAAPTAVATPRATAPTAGTLPFTGYDVVPIAIAGLVLLAAGLTLRASRRGERE